MKERPIIFSGPMVRAVLEGRKTQARRFAGDRVWQDAGGTVWTQKLGSTAFESGPCYWHCPYGKPDDRLWVRETWCFAHPDYHGEAEGERLGRPMRDGRWCHYAATDNVDYDDNRSPWRSPLHMPRWAARLLLEVTEVRVQRLQDISEEDARAEGLALEPLILPGHAVGCFARLWDTINGTAGKRWSDNPWIWAISFRRVEGL